MTRALRLSTDEFARLQSKRARNKFGNEPTAGNASRKEANRAIELRAMLERGEIYALREQVTFELIPEQHAPDGRLIERACDYRADFTYQRTRDDVLVAEDVKGYRTAEYRIKRKLFLYRYGFPLSEV